MIDDRVTLGSCPALVAPLGPKAQSAVTLRRTGSTTMPDPRNSRMTWIGAWGALFGTVVYSLAQADEMLPINRFLFGIISTLMLIWLLVILFDGPGRQS